MFGVTDHKSKTAFKFFEDMISWVWTLLTVHRSFLNLLIQSNPLINFNSLSICLRYKQN